MEKTYKILMSTIITLVFWIVSRMLPGAIAAAIGETIYSRSILLILFLPLGWYLCELLSKGNHSKCIRFNLWIFAFIEATGLLTIFTMILQLMASTGRYSVDMYGIPYSSYHIIIGWSIIFIVSYVALCVYLRKKTKCN